MKILEAKIYPNKAQEQALAGMLEGCRVLYNRVLEAKINHYKATKKTLGRGELQKTFKATELPASVSQMVIYRVNIAFKRFFNKQGSFPRFKAENRYRSIELRQYGVNWDYSIRKGRLFAWKKFGLTNLKLRGLQQFETAKMGRLVKRASGWYLQVCVETVDKKPIKKVKSVVGLDVGLKSFIVDSRNKATKAPKFFIQSQNKLAVGQRLIAKKVKGSKRRKKQVRLVAKIHEKITNQRKDFLHKLSRVYVNKYDLIAVEKLNIKGMVRNRHLSKAISDASWGHFTTYLSYKLRMLGKVFVEVNPYMTTQNCSACGETVRKTLSVRTHACPNCGFVTDRDHNAALNILNRGLERTIGEGIAIASPLTQRMT